VFPTAVKDTVPLYRGWNPTWRDHFYTADKAEMDRAVSGLGFTAEGIAGYVYPTAQCGAIPLYRTYQARLMDHFYTSNAAERDNAVKNLGYSDEGIAGYILNV